MEEPDWRVDGDADWTVVAFEEIYGEFGDGDSVASAYLIEDTEDLVLIEYDEWLHEFTYPGIPIVVQCAVIWAWLVDA